MADLIKVSIVGTMPGGEEWSVNPVFRLNGAPESVDYSDCLAIATAIDALTIGSNIRLLMSSSTAVTGCRVEARNVDGTLDATADHVRSSAVVGTGSSPHPFQTSVVVSLRTPGAGGSGRGRMYWPATGAGVIEASLRASSSGNLNFLTDMRTYLVAIEAIITAQVGEAILAVWSRRLETTFGVTRLLIGDILDVQRRRRDVVPENYQQLDFPS